MSSSVQRLTAPGVGGVAVLVLRGSEAEGRLARGFSAALPAPGGIVHGVLRDTRAVVTSRPSVATEDDAILDEVLVVRRPDGELELHLHGSPAVVRDVRRMLDGHSALSVAPADELRPPLEERARRRVHRAPTELGARILLDQAEGALRRELESLRAMDGAERARALVRIARRGLARERLFVRTVVVLAGPVNAGKSTLFNVLVGEDAAAVTSDPGTTRDALGERARFGPWPVILVDTAGRRDLEAALAGGDRAAAVESEGQRLAAEAAARADLVMELQPSLDGSHSTGGESSRHRPQEGGEAVPRVVLVTQAARERGPDAAGWGRRVLSALEEPDHARREVLQAFTETLGLVLDESEVWRPGLGVPFERALCDRIAFLGRSAEVPVAALDALLADL